jgi:integrase
MQGRLATMPRRATGTIEKHPWKDGRTVTFRLKVRAYGNRYRITLGTNHEGWSTERARVELEQIMRQIERGTWEPPVRREAPPNDLDRDETVRTTAYRWWQRRRTELSTNTQADYKWWLDHVLGHLANDVTAELDARKVDDFRQQLVARGLSPRSVNMVLDLLAQILDDAVEYKLLDANPARGKRRRMKVPKSSRTFLEPDMVVDLLDAAGAWERDLPEHQRYGRRALLATLCLSGPRISELIDSPRGRLDLHAGQLVLGKKTEAGIDRTLELSAFLLDELRPYLAAVPARLRDAHGPGLPIFPTRTGGRLNPSNVRNRLLNGTPARKGKQPTKGVVQRVNEKRAADGRMLLPDRVTPHTFRRTFASLCFFVGRDLRWVMGQLGHDDPRMTLGVYAQCMKRSQIDEALLWQLMRFPDEEEMIRPSARRDHQAPTRRRSGGSPPTRSR